MKTDSGIKMRTCAAAIVIAAAMALPALLMGGCGWHGPADAEAGQPAESQSDPDSQQIHPDLPADVQEAPAEPGEEPAAEAEDDPEAEPAGDPEPEPPQDGQDEAWKLILVNADHPVPEDYEVTLKELRNDQWVDERIYPELQQMFDDARAEGIYPLINESFRSDERQQEILDSYTAAYVDSGMSEAEALEQTLTVVAVPGTSEHQLGLALDIISETDEDDTATWQWLRDNCWHYGFILRYPEDKTEITGIGYEPWHFRYVGKEAAQSIMEQGITLEEYLDEDK